MELRTQSVAFAKSLATNLGTIQRTKRGVFLMGCQKPRGKPGIPGGQRLYSELHALK